MRFSGYDGAIQYPVGIGFSLKYCMMMGLQFNALAFPVHHLPGVVPSARGAGIGGHHPVLHGDLRLPQRHGHQLHPVDLPDALSLFGPRLRALQPGGWQPVAQYYQAAGQPEALSLFQGFGWVKELIYYCITMGLLVIVGNQDDLQPGGLGQKREIREARPLSGDLPRTPHSGDPLLCGRRGPRCCSGRAWSPTWCFTPS